MPARPRRTPAPASASRPPAAHSGAGKPSAPAFSGFVTETLKFLRALGFHQSREWFEAHRDLYESALRGPMKAYVEALSAACAARKIPLRGDPAKAVFRIHRDVRFSKNKHPYKTNGGCVISRTGGKGAQGIVYTHVSPEGCFFAAGFRALEPDQLLLFRKAIARKPNEFLAMEKRLASVGLSFATQYALTRNPRDFQDVDARVAHAVRLKGFIVRRPYDEGLLLDGGEMVAAAAEFASDAMPLLTWGWKVLG